MQKTRFFFAFSFFALVISLSAGAQSDKYTQTMQKNITLLDSARSIDQLQNLANTFDRIGDAEKDTARLIRLINEMLDIDRIESGNFALDRSRFDIAPLLEDAIDSVTPLAADKLIRFTRQIENLSMNADRERILRVVINLLHNAIKFSPTGSSILISAAQDNRRVMVSIRDSGPGIARDEIKRIFEPFQQLHPTDATTLGGTGLGLAICKGIVEAHGGLIGVRSGPDKGSLFWFSIDAGSPTD